MTCFRPNSDKMYADITDGIAIIINSETGIYFGMNSFGSMVYENLANGVSTEKVWDKIKTFGTDELNFKQFIEELLKNDILLAGTETGAEVNIDENCAKEDNGFLELKAYDDAQELLLADPIHDVKEEEGWSPEKTSLNEDKDDVLRREAKMEL